MKNRRGLPLSFLFLTAFAWAASPAAPADPFAEEAARRTGTDAKNVVDLRRRGFGKTELLSFIAIAAASKKPWDDLVKERLRGKPLRRMAEEAGLDYNPLFENSSALKIEINLSLEKKPLSPQN